MTGVQTCALPIFDVAQHAARGVAVAVEMPRRAEPEDARPDEQVVHRPDFGGLGQAVAEDAQEPSRRPGIVDEGVMLLADSFKPKVTQWATLQAYLALGNLLTSAGLLGVDACPMEGFVPAEYDKVLGLSEQGYASVVCCALGYRAATDKYATAKKVRGAKSDLVKVI